MPEFHIQIGFVQNHLQSVEDSESVRQDTEVDALVSSYLKNSIKESGNHHGFKKSDTYCKFAEYKNRMASENDVVFSGDSEN